MPELLLVGLIVGAVAVGAFLLLGRGLLPFGSGQGAASGEPAVPAGGSAVGVTISVIVGENDGPGTNCGTGNFGTMYMNLPGAAVQVRNEAGTIVGTANVPAYGVVSGTGMSAVCTFNFQVPLSGHANFYEFDFGEFGKVTKSRQDLETTGWQMVLS